MRADEFKKHFLWRCLFFLSLGLHLMLGFGLMRTGSLRYLLLLVITTFAMHRWDWDWLVVCHV
jgi:hypothetical protein